MASQPQPQPGPYAPLLAQVTRLQPLLDTLRAHHTALRAQNDKLVRTGVAMEHALRPIEDGMRIERERRAAEEAAGRTRYTGGRGDNGEEGREEVRGVDSSGGGAK